MQQYFYKGNPQSPLVVTDKDTAKTHVFGHAAQGGRASHISL